MADSTVFYDSIDPQMPEDIFTSRELSWIQDLNGGSYQGGFINIDSSTLSSNDRWIDWKSGFIEIPFTVLMKASTDITGAVPSGWMAGMLKSGSWNLINSFSVDFQNTNIVQQTQFLNMFINYKVLSSWSADTLKKYGHSVGMGAIDTPSSFAYSAGASADGNGISNNKAFAITSSFASNLEGANTGLRERAYNSAYSPVSGLNSLPVQGSSTTYNTNVAQNYYVQSGTGANAIYCFHVLATIRLKDVCDFFQKVPLLKRGFFRFTIGYNAMTSMTVALTNGPTMTMSSNPTMIGNTNPVMVLSAAAGNPMNTIATAGASSTLTFSSGIGSASLSGSTINNPFLTSCRLYVYSYMLSSEYEKQYYEVGASKDIIYEDVYNYNITGVAAGSNFNSILSNTIVNPKMVVIIPQINSASNGTAQLIPRLSPFDTAPFTTCPLAQLYNFQIVVSGDNLWQQAELYDFDQYLSEVSQDGAVLNGGKVDQLTSGLLSSRDWQFGYRYYCGNLARRRKTLDGVPRSIAVSATNNSAVVMDYFCFITMQKKISINVVSGELSM